MGRYRPPRAKSTPLITVAGEKRLREELELLWREERPRVAQAVQDAAKNGDRSENGDYIYGKKRLREIDSRVRFLSKRLEELQVVRELPTDRDRVYFGATVTLLEEDGRERSLTILGADEFEASRDEVSIDSPIARALLGKTEGDRITFESPQGTRRIDIVEVDYPPITA